LNNNQINKLNLHINEISQEKILKQERIKRNREKQKK
jgi:hypothetical protein